MFGPFEIVRSLGAGGMAETSLAIRRGEGGFEQRVCLKRILPAYGKDKDFVRAFVDEAKLAVRLEHPNVCRLYDFGQIDGTYWMSLEICEGGDLRELLQSLREMRQPMPTDIVVLLALDLAQALHYAHALRIDGVSVDLVHRDISPSNVLIDGHGHFKLADFGIARARTNSHVTQSGVVKGKAPYMSPDHVQGRTLDARDDLWSLGVMLFECLTGERPFTAPNDVALMVKVMQGERRSLRELAPDAPPVLVRAIERLLTQDRAQRTPSAAALIEDLESIAPSPTTRLRLQRLITAARAESTRREADGLAPTDPAQSAAPVRTTPLVPDPARPVRVVQEVTPGRPSDATRTSQPSRADSGPGPEARGVTPLTTSVKLPPQPVSRAGLAGMAVAGLLLFFVPIAWFGRGLISGEATPIAPEVTPAAPIAATQPPVVPPVVVAPPVAQPPVAPSTVVQPTSAPTAPSSQPVAVPEPVPAAPPETEHASETPQAEPEESTRGTVDLTVAPWGSLFIDGRHVGDGHVVRSVSPGSHRVGAAPAGDTHPAHQQTITVRPGQRVRMTLRAVE